VWNVFAVDLKEMLTIEPGAIYRVEIRFKQEYSLYPCENTPVVTQNELSDDAEDVDENFIWDKGYYWPKWEWNDDYEWSRREDPCHASYYMNRWVYRNVLATNLGIMVKSNGNDKYLTVVTNLTSATAVGNANVSFFNHQNQLLGQVSTNSDGMADITLSGKPWLAMAEAGGQKTWLRVNDGSALSYSSFDVGGMSTHKGLQGFIYGDRGVWRPGDTLHLCFIVHDEAGDLPHGQPATLYFYNPEGKLVNKLVNTSPVEKFYRFDLKTAANDPTGNWTVKVKIGGALFSKTVKIETIKPNRLKINLDFGTEQLDGSKSVSGKLAVNWLHGATGKNLKTRVDLNFAAKKTTFGGFDKFVFDDPAKEFESKEETVFDGVTAADGNAAFGVLKNLTKNAPGMLKAIFTVKAFEPGGEFSIVQRMVDFSPFERYVGLRMPDMPKNQWFYTSGKEYPLEIVTLSKNGKPVDAENLEVIFYKIDWSWWWNSGSENLAYYIGSKKYQPVFTKKISTKNGKATVNIKVGEREWGRYFVRVVDKNGHSTGYITYFDWPWRKSNEGAGGATRLTFSTDKEKYTVGDNVKVLFPGEIGSRAFVTVECDNRILLSRWVEVSEGGGNIEIVASEAMSPNAYINIVLLQPHARTINENPIRMYGAIPLFVDNPRNKLFPVIKMDNKLEPEKSFSVQISEQNSKEMTYTIAIVDEGLLDITNFKTPNPHESFFRRRGLTVKTWDVFDLVSGAYGGKLEKVFGIGGDEDLVNKEKKDDGRFKPVVLYAGPFTLKAGKTQKHTFTMPKYIGSVKTMVVAGSNNAYGNAETVTPVKTPVMVLATLPRLLAPGEKVALPVSVFAMDGNVKKVDVEVKSNDMFRAASSKKSIEINGEGEYNCSFDLMVAEREGTGKVEVVVKSSLGTATYDISIQVRNPNPRIKQTISRLLQAGAQNSIAFTLLGIPGTNEASLELSSIPPINLKGRLDELIRYPYGCVEQTVSAALPQLFVNRLAELTPDMMSQTETNIMATIAKLQGYQRSDGGFSYWPGSANADDWGTSYAGHFLIEAEKAGYLLPFGMKDRWLNYQKSAASNWKNTTLGSSSALRQAYRLYTMALCGRPDLSAMNRLRLTDNLSRQAKWRLALTYALAGRPEIAGELIDVRNLEIAPFEEFDGSYGSAERDLAMLLETFVQLGNKEQAARISKVLSEALSSEKWYSTQTVSWMILSVSKAQQLVIAGKGGMNAEYQFALSGTKSKVNTGKSMQQISWNPDRDTVVSVTNKSDGVLFVTVTYSGIPYRDNTPAISKKLEMKVRFVDLQGNELNPQSIQQGTDFKMVATIKHSGENLGLTLSNVAFTQVFPSGWEIINSRLYGAGYQTKSDIPDYLDIRDDRVNLFFNLESGATKRFEVLLNAAYVGEYVLPAATAFTMYSNSYYAKTSSSMVKVVRE
jgi:alpha-2-macroglobulin